MSDWLKTSESLPRSGRHVLAYYKNDHGNGRIVRAFYAAKNTTIADSGSCESSEYNEKEDRYYLNQGWYEENEHDDFYYDIFEEVTHWMPFPKYPTNA